MKKIKAPNILVVGKTGVGKSSLINAIFGEELAKTGAGFPVTEIFHFYSNGLVNIYDSAGYEFSSENIFILNIFNFLNSKQKAGIEEQIHIVWYLINAASSRVERFDIEIINQIRKYGIPLVIILSQVDRARDEEIKGIKSVLTPLNVSDIIEVAASPLIIRGKPICEPFGLEEVVEKTIVRLPEIYADALRMAQIIDIKSKRELAWKLIAAAAAVTFSSAWLPIPGATTGASLGAQEYLAVSIASVYGFAQKRELLPQIYRGKITKSTLSVAGVTLGFDILSKLIPVAGSLIAGGTAATLIVITGLAYASAFETMAQFYIDPDDSKTFNRFLNDSFQEALAKYSNVVIRTTKDLAKVKDRFLNQ
ncbi:MAG: GTPase domain-containing protein [Nodularia sp. (in: cyanobacteria)]|nr:GTPase domain-containing protein [Nodularia sp. (in: cyanobacteria)]